MGAILVCTVLLTICTTHDAAAGSGGALSFPVAGTKAAHGLTLRVDTSWINGYGYRPVRLRLSTSPAGTKAKADRVLLVELLPRQSNFRESTLVTQFIELPEGQSTAEATMLVPVENDWDFLELEVYEDGVRLNELSEKTYVTSEGISFSRSRSSHLIVASAAPPLADRSTPLSRRATGRLLQNSQMLRGLAGRRALQDIAPLIPQMSQNPDDAAILRGFDNEFWGEVVRPEDLPTNWLGLTEVDVLDISLAELRKLASQHPRQFAAVRRWLATGTTLNIVGSGEAIDQREIEQLFEMPAVVKRDADSGDDLGGDKDAPQPWSGWAPPVRGGSYHSRRVGFGRVVASDGPFTQAMNDQPLGDPFPSHSNWTTRHGVAPRQQDPTVANWLIPGVGAPPTTAFRILITMFVVVIGPLNVWLVRRLRRSYLIMVTVPVAAFSVTALLLGYAAVSDGFDVKARIVSYTLEDQRQGLTVGVSRQSYFAAFVPSEGLVFPAETAVYPAHAGMGEDWSREQRIDWRGDKQRLSQGYLSARQPAQFVVLHSELDAPPGLEIKSDDGDMVRVVNRFGGRIQVLLLVDRQGRIHRAANIAADTEVKLQQSQIVSPSLMIQGQLRSEALDELRLQLPPPRFTSNASPRRRRNWDASLLASLLADFGDGSPEAGTYFAIVDTSTATPIGAEVNEVSSLHLVEGRW